jgi:hypothetical protein
MHHVFMLDDEREALYNSGVVAHLRDQITRCIGRKGTVKAHLEKALTSVQQRFADSKEPFQLRLLRVPKDGKEVWRVLSAKGNEPAAVAAATHEMHLPSYLSLGSDELQYNIVRVVGATSAGGGTNGAGPAQQKKYMYLLQLVLPGMTKAAPPTRIRSKARFSASIPNRTEPTPFRKATCSRRELPKPGLKSILWAIATLGACPWTASPALFTGVKWDRTRDRILSLDPTAMTNSTKPAGRASSAGLTL